MINNDTIVAPATPPGEGGIGIIRLSGPRAIVIARSIFRAGGISVVDHFESHHLYYGFVVDLKDGRRLDEVMLTVMAAPRSYTREDVVEISAHGGLLPLRQILHQVIMAGARLAQPGEYTRRAFLNGRLDLTQAEAVMGLIRARTDAGLKNSVRQLGGHLAREIDHLRGRVVDLLSGLEARIDFPEDVAEMPADELLILLQRLLEDITGLTATADRGRVMQEGAALVIAGRPNVGKSSLLNALLREARAIVTDMPGTTRDVVEAIANINGVPVRAMDTAGIRATADPVERIGVARARSALAQADLVLMVLDGSFPLSEEDRLLAVEIGQQRSILVINKTDLPRRIDEDAVAKLIDGSPVIRISTLTGEGMADLEAEIASLLIGEDTSPESVLIANLRQLTALEKAANALRACRQAAFEGAPAEILAVDLRDASDALGEITGETTTEDVLDKIFSEFCVGK